MILRLLNVQGAAGLAAAVALLGLLIFQRLDAQHWHRESARLEDLYHDEQLAFAKTTAAYREAVDTARAQDRANAARVTAQQQMINERTEDDYEKRLAAARLAADHLAADRLRGNSAAGAADRGRGGAAPVPVLPIASGSTAQAAGDYGLPAAGPEGNAALTATEQAIQLDELIKWVKRQSAIDPNGSAERSSR
jgi:hypothetical protein